MSRTSVHETAVLCRGHHAHPRQGACLAELAATLPGGRWTDHPAGADPMLAALARAVNDDCTEEGRRDLLALLPWLPRPVPGPAPAAGARIVGMVGRQGLAVADAALAARLAPDLAAVATADSRERGFAAYRRRHRAMRAIRLSVRALSRCDDADQRLWWLLHDAINLTRAADGLPTLPDRAEMRLPDRWPRRLPVRVHIRVPDGAESTYYHCSPVWEGWPIRLRHDWAARQGELRLIIDTGPPDR